MLRDMAPKGPFKIRSNISNAFSKSFASAASRNSWIAWGATAGPGAMIVVIALNSREVGCRVKSFLAMCYVLMTMAWPVGR